MSVLVVGSIALDTVKTPVEEHTDQLGGSASYAAVGASFFSPVNLVGVVGDDFPASEFDFWKTRRIDASGVQRAKGKTFRWSGEYEWDLNSRQTKSVALNVFENFKPDLPENFRETNFVLLANIAPALQSHVLDQMRRPRFVVADTMDLWIETTRKDLDALLPRVDLLILNDSEARQMTGDTSLIRAGRALQRGIRLPGDWPVISPARAAARLVSPSCARQSSTAACWPASTSRHSASTASVA